MSVTTNQVLETGDLLELERLFFSMEQYHQKYERVCRLIDIVSTGSDALTTLGVSTLSTESAILTDLYLQAVDVDNLIQLDTLIPSMEAYAEPTLSMEASSTALDRLKVAAAWLLKVLSRLWSRIRNLVQSTSSNLDVIIRAAKDELNAAGNGAPVERTVDVGSYAAGLVTGFKLPGGGTSLLSDLKVMGSVARATVYDYPATLQLIADDIISVINKSNRSTYSQIARELTQALGQINRTTLAGFCTVAIGDDPRYKNSNIKVTKSNNWNDSRTLFFEHTQNGDIVVGRLKLDTTYPGGLEPLKDTRMVTIRQNEARLILAECDSIVTTLKEMADGSRQTRLENRVKAMQSSLNTLISVNGIDNDKLDLIQSAISNFSVNITMPTTRILDMVYKAVRSAASAVRLSARLYQ